MAATQNPVEYEGTYPLPEAQLDRFLLKVVLPIPQRDDELEILHRHACGFDPRDVAAAGVQAVAGGRGHRGRQAAVEGAGRPRGRRLHRRHRAGHPRVAVALARREPPWRYRAAALGARVGVANGRDFVTPDDVKALAHATLVHRLGLRPEAELEGVDVAEVLASALGSVPVPR